MGRKHEGDDRVITSEQQFIIDQPLAGRVLVTAGAGTGKTLTLIYRAKKLIEIDRLHAGGEILVLSFSRSAVREIRQRVQCAGGDLSYLRARTFDTFATRLLATVQPDGQWVGQNYDERIASAIRVILSNNEPTEFLRTFRHVIVDEIQDLVGLRAELVKALLIQNQDAGFTLLGDPAQGIYNFHLSGDARRAGSAALYSWLRNTFRGQLIEKTLSKNFRATTKTAEAALWAGESLTSPNPDYPGIFQRLTCVKAGLRTIADAVTLTRGLSQAYTGTTAVLCRTNGEALYVSNQLRDSKVDHRLQSEAPDRIVSPWLAVCVAAMPSRVIAKTTFLRAYPKLAEEWFTAEDGWLILRRIDRGAQSIDLAAIATKLRIGDFPDDIVPARNDKIIVSTIHRAKGLEFDRVFLLYDLPPEREDEEEDDAERARLLYVALTRAKRDIFRVGPLQNVFLSFNKYAERWRVPCRASRYMTCGLEVRSTDSRSDIPAGFDGSAASDIQQYILRHVRRGDAVLLNRIMRRVGEDLQTQYEILHGDKNIGLLDGSAVFATMKVFSGWKVVMPLRIRGVYVDDIDSVAGLHGAAQRSGLGFADIWLRVRVAGLGTPEYSDQELQQVKKRCQ
jgi:hypothetical protein